jgi:hypothetical protein
VAHELIHKDLIGRSQSYLIGHLRHWAQDVFDPFPGDPNTFHKDPFTRLGNGALEPVIIFTQATAAPFICSGACRGNESLLSQTARAGASREIFDTRE